MRAISPSNAPVFNGISGIDWLSKNAGGRAGDLPTSTERCLSVKAQTEYARRHSLRHTATTLGCAYHREMGNGLEDRLGLTAPTEAAGLAVGYATRQELAATHHIGACSGADRRMNIAQIGQTGGMAHRMLLKQVFQ